METKFNFNSQVCTSKAQSECLLSLGLRKETADCYIVVEKEEVTVVPKPYYEIIKDLNGLPFDAEISPAWSLHRLIEMIDDECVVHLDNFTITGRLFEVYDNLYDNIIDCIEWLIKEGHFNKEYLEE